MTHTQGISLLICNSNEEYYDKLNKLRGDNIIFFNTWTKYSLSSDTYFKDKKIAKMKGIRKILAKIFYKFIPDVPVKKELETYSESSNKRFMCIKDLVANPIQKYVIGLAGFDIATIEEILEYFISEKKEYSVLFVGINDTLSENAYYHNIDKNTFVEVDWRRSLM